MPKRIVAMPVTRRKFLGSTVAVAAVSTVAGVSFAVEVDPIFAAIEAHRLVVAEIDALNALGVSDYDEIDRRMPRLCERAWHAAWNMVEVEPTTRAGLTALLAYVVDLNQRDHLGYERAPRPGEPGFGHELATIDFADDVLQLAVRTLQRLSPVNA